jgi:hypothetical protein
MTARLSRPLLALLLGLAALAALPATGLAAAPAVTPAISLPAAAVAFAAVHHHAAGHVDAALVGVLAVVVQPENRVKGQTYPRVLATLKSASLAALSQLAKACGYDGSARAGYTYDGPGDMYVNGDPVNLYDPTGHKFCRTNDPSGDCDAFRGSPLTGAPLVKAWIRELHRQVAVEGCIAQLDAADPFSCGAKQKRGRRAPGIGGLAQLLAMPRGGAIGDQSLAPANDGQAINDEPGAGGTAGLAGVAALLLIIVGDEQGGAAAPRRVLADNPRGEGAQYVLSVSSDIATGHAWDKHQGEFPEAADRGDFAKLLDQLLGDKGTVAKPLGRGRTGWLTPDGTIVIDNPNPGEEGTAFRPPGGYDAAKDYFDKVLK